MDNLYYLEQLYPFQDLVLSEISNLDTGFYLTGGTALSRAYLGHRFSDDLDFFVNDDGNFQLWGERIIQRLASSINWACRVEQREERYLRLNLTRSGINLKIEMINDVPSRIGLPWMHQILGRIDTAENILANKVTAILDREASKDMADIWGLCCKKDYSLHNAISGAQGKAAGIFPVDLARILCSVDRSDWELVRWIEAPDPEQYVWQLNELGKKLILMEKRDVLGE
jgi:hypothetical protein